MILCWSIFTIHNIILSSYTLTLYNFAHVQLVWEIDKISILYACFAFIILFWPKSADVSKLYKWGSSDLKYFIDSISPEFQNLTPFNIYTKFLIN